MLQKPHQKSEDKEHSIHLDCWVRVWASGDINALMLECRTIQSQLAERNSIRVQNLPKLMIEGKVQAALRTITVTDNGGVRSLTKEMREALIQTPPSKDPPVPSAMIQPDTPLKKAHFIIMFQQIDGHMIREIALKADGTIRPSGLDTAAWKHLCSSFSSFSSDVCDAMASITRRICSSYEDASGLTVITACRLIAIDKCPGVRPIGIGDTAHCIISRAILTNFVQDRRQDVRKPSLTGQNAFSDAECKRMVLPVCLGGLGITNPQHRQATSTVHHRKSQHL